MDLKLLFTSFGLIFLAELGDKTQMASVILAAKTRNPWMVFAGASLALVSITLLSVMFAHLISGFIPERTIKILAASGFLIIGCLMLADKV